MNLKEHLLFCLVEEAGEIIQAAAKSGRFGLDDRYPKPDSQTAREHLGNELNDLFAIVEMLQSEGVFPLDLYNKELVKAKKEKVRKYMLYAFDKGTLEELKAYDPVPENNRSCS